MQKITPYLWFNNTAEEAVKLYISTFKHSKTGHITYNDEASAKASGNPEGSVLTIEFQLEDYKLGALNGGPAYSLTPAVSLYVNCSTIKELNSYFEKLSKEGSILMPLQEYPFSQRYAWIQDKYGLSWQLNLTEETSEVIHKIIPSFLFVGSQHGRAEEAIKQYTSIFKNSSINIIARYEPGEGGETGKIKYSSFTLDGNTFNAMESNFDHHFTLTPAFSFLVNCIDQKEVDNFWEQLSEGGEKGVCGWLTDRYGVSWQIVPTILEELLKDNDPEKSRRVMRAMLTMKKIEISGLEKAYTGKQ